MFHHKYSFDDFLNIDISQNITKINFHQGIIFKANKKLKAYQVFLNHIIISYMKINKNVVYSYRKESSVYQALFPHKQNKYFLKLDIKSFFDSVNVSLIEKSLIASISEYILLEQDIKKYLKSILNIITYQEKLPVGFSTSPKLSNAILYDFDNEIERYCRLQGITFTRFSDDLIFSANHDGCLEKVIDKTELTLKQYYNNIFSLNPKKTHIYKPWDRVHLLGLVITSDGNITVRQKYKKKIEVAFHYYSTDKIKFADFLKNNFYNSMSSISGTINYMYDIDSSYVLKLKKKYGNYVVDYFMHRPTN